MNFLNIIGMVIFIAVLFVSFAFFRRLMVSLCRQSKVGERLVREAREEDMVRRRKRMRVMR